MVKELKAGVESGESLKVILEMFSHDRRMQTILGYLTKYFDTISSVSNFTSYRSIKINPFVCWPFSRPAL